MISNQAHWLSLISRNNSFVFSFNKANFRSQFEEFYLAVSPDLSRGGAELDDTLRGLSSRKQVKKGEAETPKVSFAPFYSLYSFAKDWCSRASLCIEK